MKQVGVTWYRTVKSGVYYVIGTKLGKKHMLTNNHLVSSWNEQVRRCASGQTRGKQPSTCQVELPMWYYHHSRGHYQGSRTEASTVSTSGKHLWKQKERERAPAGFRGKKGKEREKEKKMEAMRWLRAHCAYLQHLLLRAVRTYR